MNITNRIENSRPVVTKFVIQGLFGYKTVTVDFSSPVKIISAENGTGKTTLLNALYWILTGQFFRLQTINFHQILVYFHNGKHIAIPKDRVVSITLRDIDSKSPTINIRRWGLSQNEVMQIMETYLQYGDGEAFRACDAYKKLYRDSPWDHDELKDKVHNLVEKYVDTEQFCDIKEIVDEALEGAEILYLPTYRRIEANLGVEKAEKAEGSKDKLIYFGLSDVEETLDRITANIKASALAAYTKISATFLDNLVATGELENAAPISLGTIDQEALKMVLARIGKSSDDPTVVKIDNLTINGNINDLKYYHLKYFLSELIASSKSQEAQEEAINGFINIVNGYWGVAEAEKEFVYDKYNVEVFVNNKMSGTRVPLRVLSSGEKQIVSVFSRLFFSDANSYFVIIDEPELSLSIDWQRLFLPNIVSSPKCRALLAITHSPFVFENELDPYASSVKTEKWVQHG